MAVLSPPPEREDLELLIREARARQRRRWTTAAVVLALTTAAGLVAYAVLSAGNDVQRGARGNPLPGAPVQRCQSGDLRLTGRFDGAGTGTVRTTFTFVNLSAARCTLRGWPSLRVVLPSGGSAAAASLRKNGSNRPLLHPRIVLRPGSAASFEVLYSDGVGLSHPCPGTRAVLVTPPGARQGLRLRFGMDYCGRGSVLVAPLVAGRSDRHWF